MINYENKRSAGIIPQNVQAFAKDFVALAIKHNLDEASIKLNFGYGPDRQWDEPIHISWEAGRHGADSKKYFISTTINISGKAEIAP